MKVKAWFGNRLREAVPIDAKGTGRGGCRHAIRLGKREIRCQIRTDQHRGNVHGTVRVIPGISWEDDR